MCGAPTQVLEMQCKAFAIQARLVIGVFYMEVANEKQFDVQKEVECSHGRNVGKLVWNLTLWVGKVFSFPIHKGACVESWGLTWFVVSNEFELPILRT